MHDCKIPATLNLRNADIKKYVEKLEILKQEFSDAEKLNIELDPTNSR